MRHACCTHACVASCGTKHTAAHTAAIATSDHHVPPHTLTLTAALAAGPSFESYLNVASRPTITVTSQALPLYCCCLPLVVSAPRPTAFKKLQTLSTPATAAITAAAPLLPATLFTSSALRCPLHPSCSQPLLQPYAAACSPCCSFRCSFHTSHRMQDDRQLPGLDGVPTIHTSFLWHSPRSDQASHLSSESLHSVASGTFGLGCSICSIACQGSLLTA
jgi:hypothetical protein